MIKSTKYQWRYINQNRQGLFVCPYDSRKRSFNVFRARAMLVRLFPSPIYVL